MVKRIAVAVHGKSLEKSRLFPISWLFGRLFFILKPWLKRKYVLRF
jgi:hypothetical protein